MQTPQNVDLLKVISIENNAINITYLVSIMLSGRDMLSLALFSVALLAIFLRLRKSTIVNNSKTNITAGIPNPTTKAVLSVSKKIHKVRTYIVCCYYV